MFDTYVEKKLAPHNVKLVEQMNTIVVEYQSSGYMLTVRQLYYQLVARDLVPNNLKSYKRVASICNDGRLAGLMDWSAIEDRTRNVEVRSRWTSGASIIAAVADQFHMDMWEGQEHRLYVIVEKEALVGVMQRVCQKYDVPLLAARGYPSVSIIRDMVLDHILPAIERGQEPIILHLGDHDPSGIDMTRDLSDRIDMFLRDESHSYLLQRIALSMPQISETKAPPNPAKTTDSRFAQYKKKYGTESWELDALEPQYLDELVKLNIERHIDFGIWTEREDEIAAVKVKLNRVAENYESI